MKVRRVEEVESVPVEMEGAVGVTKRVVVGPAEEAPHFHMRVFDVRAGGETPLHSHEGEHEVYVLAGRGTVMDGDVPRELVPGTVVWVPEGDVHQFRADRGEPLRFICVIPRPRE
jgi:quercetin dioxygenase-like cupin family protein